MTTILSTQCCLDDDMVGLDDETLCLDDETQCCLDDDMVDLDDDTVCLYDDMVLFR